jgi:DNA modification methylase
MDFLEAGIGSAKDNQRSPIHDWYKFTAGFSYKFVDEIIQLERLGRGSTIFDPFAGCGTTLVSAQKHGIRAVGNESQQLMYEVIKAKLDWSIEDEQFEFYFDQIENYVRDWLHVYDLKLSVHTLLKTLYKKNNLKTICLIRDSIEKIEVEKYRLFFKLALCQTLHKVSIHPIAVPYISRNKSLSGDADALSTFQQISEKMFADIAMMPKRKRTSTIYKQDSRKANRFIEDKSNSVCITSPPYLNNLDYGEISKVHTHFFNITNTWSDITKTVRRKLVTGATTHYVDSAFNWDDFTRSEFSLTNTKVSMILTSLSKNIKQAASDKSGKKSFDLLVMHYFIDMNEVIKEIRRTLKTNKRAYLILGDSAPYGVFIPTTKILGQIAINNGFKKYEIHKIRGRGTKWKSLRFRHSMELTENVLVLQ